MLTPRLKGLDQNNSGNFSQMMSHSPTPKLVESSNNSPRHHLKKKKSLWTIFINRQKNN